jgi:hypothetical protein
MSHARAGVAAGLLAALLGACGGEDASRPGQGADAVRPPPGADAAIPLGESVHFPECGLRVRQPEGFEVSKTFAGFGQEATGSSVLATMIPGPFEKVAAGFTPALMKSRGMVLHAKEDILLDDLPAKLVHFEQVAQGTTYLKWLAVFGDESTTRMVTATFPATHASELSALLRATVLSARIDDSVPMEPGEELPFTLEASPKLKLARGMSRSLTYTTSGTLPMASPDDPLFVAIPSFAQKSPADRRAFAERTMRDVAREPDLVLKSTEPVTIAGLGGFESVAETKCRETGSSLTLYQVMLFEKESHVILSGRVATALAQEYLPEFRAMARSFRRK